jgi:hypothetical protein
MYETTKQVQENGEVKSHVARVYRRGYTREYFQRVSLMVI